MCIWHADLNRTACLTNPFPVAGKVLQVAIQAEIEIESQARPAQEIWLKRDSARVLNPRYNIDFFRFQQNPKDSKMIRIDYSYMVNLPGV